jgi:hypothetical protein
VGIAHPTAEEQIMSQAPRLNKVIDLLEQGFRIIISGPTRVDRALAVGKKTAGR